MKKTMSVFITAILSILFVSNIYGQDNVIKKISKELNVSNDYAYTYLKDLYYFFLDVEKKMEYIAEKKNDLSKKLNMANTLKSEYFLNNAIVCTSSKYHEYIRRRTANFYFRNLAYFTSRSDVKVELYLAKEFIIEDIKKYIDNSGNTAYVSKVAIWQKYIRYKKVGDGWIKVYDDATKKDFSIITYPPKSINTPFKFKVQNISVEVGNTISLAQFEDKFQEMPFR